MTKPELKQHIIEKILPQSKLPVHQRSVVMEMEVDVYNKALHDTHAKLDEVIDFIYADLREKIVELYQDEHPVDCIDGETPVETYGYEATHNQALKQVLDLLTNKE